MGITRRNDFSMSYLWILFFLFVNINVINGKVCLTRNPVTISCSNLGLDEFPHNISDEVQHLDLSNNNLNLIPPDIGRLIELKYLNLAWNKLTALPEEFGELWKLERLDLSRNDIRDVGEAIGVITRLPNLKILFLRENPLIGIENLANVAVKVLDISHCSIKSIVNTTFAGLPELVSLNLAGNPLKKFYGLQSEKLRRLDVSSCMINYLFPDALEGMPLLENLKISNNPTLVYSTRSETLRHNALKRLDASGCNLDRPGTHGLPALTHLTLSQNSIHFLPDRIFSKNPSLLFLNLAGNGLSRINSSSFTGIPRLQHLDLSGNNLEYIPTAAFRDNLELITLNLSYNDLKNFPRKLISSTINLDLTANLIENVPSDSLVNIWRLNWLDLGRNRLESFDSGISSRTLTTLSLEGNRLTRLTNSSFGGFPKLTRLDLSGNRLTEGFPPVIFEKNPNIQSIKLHDNPWLCNCEQLSKTYKFLSKNPRKTEMLSLICQSPVDVSGYTWTGACGATWTSVEDDRYSENKPFALAMIGVLLAFFSFGSVISISHTIKTKRRQAELRLREAEVQEARERLILHRRNRELEAERARHESQHAPRINPAELTGPPTYEEAVELPRMVRSLDNLDDMSTDLGHSSQSLAWERKKRMQSKKTRPKRTRSEADLSTNKTRKPERPLHKNKRSTSAPRKSVSKLTMEQPRRRNSESEEPPSENNDTWNRTRRNPGNRKKRRVTIDNRNGHSSDDERSEEPNSPTEVSKNQMGVVELPREPRSGTYRPSSSASPQSSPDIEKTAEQEHHISRSQIV